MSVSFHNGELHLPNGQAAELLEAIGYPAPIIATHGTMSVVAAQQGVVLAKSHVKEGTNLSDNLSALDVMLDELTDIGIEVLEWS